MKTRADRQLETHRMAKCACGNVAGLGETKCGRCRVADDVDAQLIEEARNRALYAGAETPSDFALEELLTRLADRLQALT
jgi:hypothetical protein